MHRAAPADGVPTLCAQRRVPSICFALCAQFLAWAGMTSGGPLLEMWRIDPSALPLVQGFAAAACGHVLGLPVWWWPLNLAFAPAAHFAHELPPVWFLSGFVLLALVFWNTYRSQVPLYLSSREACDRLDELLPKHSATVLDVGCGMGGVVQRLARSRPDCSFVGIELAPLPALIAWMRLRGRANCRVARGDLWSTDLSQHDVVYAFLSPAAMPDFWTKARAEMKRGSLLVSNSFAIAGAQPHAVVPLAGRGSSALFLWRM